MILSEGMRADLRYIQYPTMADSFIVYPFTHCIDCVLTELTEILGVVINGIHTQRQGNDGVATRYYGMDGIYGGVRTYAIGSHIHTLSPVPVRVEERTALTYTIQRIGMRYLVNVQRQVEDRITTLGRLTIDILMVNALC